MFFENNNALFDRYGPIPGLLVTSTTCYSLLTLHFTGWRGSEEFLYWIRANKVVVTILVQVISHLLGMIHVTVLCTLIRSRFLVHISKNTFPMYLVQFVHAASTPRMTWVLPLPLSLILVLIVIASFFPAALWAAAVAPLPAERNMTQILEVPTFDVANVSALWDASRNVSSYIAGAATAGQWMTDKGLFAFDPASVKYLIQPSAAEASTVTQGSRKHAKLDKTGYSYIDRSFATGAIAGFEQFEDVISPNWYTYQERGMKSKVKCFYNDSIVESFEWALLENSAGGWLAQSYGDSALGGVIPWTTYWGVTPSDLFSWSSTYDNITKQVTLQLSTLANETMDGWSFRQFQNIQCNAEYVPELFNIHVNSTGKLIFSSPCNETKLEWPAYGDKVLSTLSGWLWEFTRNDGCLGGCQLGRSIRLNVNRLQNATGDYSNETVLRGTEDYVASMTDNIMINFLLTRMVGAAPEPTKPVSVVIGIPAVVLGERSFLIAVVVINTMLIILYIVEFTTTKAWCELPHLDMTNISDLLISAFKGGSKYSQDTSYRSGIVVSDDLVYTQQDFHIDDKMKLRLQRENMNSSIPALVPLFHEDLSPMDDITIPLHPRHTSINGPKNVLGYSFLAPSIR